MSNAAPKCALILSLPVQVLEPSVPADIGVLLHNAGYGAAQSVSVTTQQPEIIDNEKQLRVAFSIDTVTLNSGTHLPARLGVQASWRDANLQHC